MSSVRETWSIMYKLNIMKNVMRNFSEKERSCELAFESGGPFWHTYTSGRQTPILFVNDQAMSLVMNIVAQAAYEYAGQIRIISFEVMNNHLHFILSGDLHSIDGMMSFILKRIRRAFGLKTLPEVTSKPIDDLTSLRNHIAYVHRNGYIANPQHTPFSYLWGTGPCYFMPAMRGRLFSEITSIENRAMFRSRDVKLPPDWQVVEVDGASGRASSVVIPEGTPGRVLFISPRSFCDINSGMAMYRDAHHYFSLISKNIEAYSGVAAELDDGEFLTDPELFVQILKLVREKYHLAAIRDLSKAQRLDLARTLHYDYRSSNGQIRRMLGLGEYEVDSLFPLV